MVKRFFKHPFTKLLVFTCSLLPLAWVVWRLNSSEFHSGDFSNNPQDYLNRYLGDWGLRFILLVLAITPIQRLTGVSALIKFRRMLGLFAFFYVCTHLLSYVWLDQGFFWPELWKDITKRTYITVGMVSFILLIPLALTSWEPIIKFIGRSRWRQLHSLIYVIAPLACLHFFMMRKGFQIEPLIYGGICALLLGIRIIYGYKTTQR